MKKTGQPHTAGEADSIELVQDVTRQNTQAGSESRVGEIYYQICPILRNGR